MVRLEFRVSLPVSIVIRVRILVSGLRYSPQVGFKVSVRVTIVQSGASARFPGATHCMLSTTALLGLTRSTPLERNVFGSRGRVRAAILFSSC